MNKNIRETDSSFREDFSNILKKRKFDSYKLDISVKAIIKKVIEESDEALISYTKKFDKFEVKDFKQLIVSKKEIDYAYAKTNLKTIKAIKHAYQRIKSYHKRQLPKDEYYKDKDGVFLGSQWKPIDSVGLYVPG